jgi:hypothetical protein
MASYEVYGIWYGIWFPLSGQALAVKFDGQGIGGLNSVLDSPYRRLVPPPA